MALNFAIVRFPVAGSIASAMNLSRKVCGTGGKEHRRVDHRHVVWSAVRHSEFQRHSAWALLRIGGLGDIRRRARIARQPSNGSPENKAERE